MGRGRLVGGLCIVLAMVGIGAPARGEEIFLVSGGPTTQPIGHFEFCKAHAADCSRQGAADPPVEMTDQRWRELLNVNIGVNSAIEPETDQELYGKREFWTYPVDRGDCEDFVLLKRRDLVEAGWPASDLLITVVRRSDGEIHAVLAVRTRLGDLILDNLTPDVRVWNETRYQFLKRQSQSDEQQWVAIEGLPTGDAWPRPAPAEVARAGAVFGASTAASEPDRKADFRR